MCKLRQSRQLKDFGSWADLIVKWNMMRSGVIVDSLGRTRPSATATEDIAPDSEVAE